MAEKETEQFVDELLFHWHEVLKRFDLLRQTETERHKALLRKIDDLEGKLLGALPHGKKRS